MAEKEFTTEELKELAKLQFSMLADTMVQIAEKDCDVHVAKLSFGRNDFRVDAVIRAYRRTTAADIVLALAATPAEPKGD